MFEKASRLKLRFASPKGSLTVEDLWDLPLTSTRGASLEGIGQSLQSEINDKAASTFRIQTESVSETSNGAGNLLTLKFDVLKHIVEVRLAENAVERAKAENKQKKQQILEIISRKQNEKLESTPLEELTAMLNSL